MWLPARWLGEEGILRGRAGTKGWERVTRVNSERRKAGEVEGREGKEVHRKTWCEEGKKKDSLGGWGEEKHTEFCNNLNSFQTMSKEPWQHGLKLTLPLIL